MQHRSLSLKQWMRMMQEHVFLFSLWISLKDAKYRDQFKMSHVGL